LALLGIDPVLDVLKLPFSEPPCQVYGGTNQALEKKESILKVMENMVLPGVSALSWKDLFLRFFTFVDA
jgi:hypothetical protein